MGFKVALVVKNPPANAGDMEREFKSWVRKIIKGGMAAHPIILAWRIPETEQSGGLQSVGSQRAGHD